MRRCRKGLSTRFSTSQATAAITASISSRNRPIAGSSGRISTTWAVPRSTELAMNHWSSGIQLRASSRGLPSRLISRVMTLPGASRLLAMAWRSALVSLMSSSRPSRLVASERPREVSALSVTRFWLGCTRIEPWASSTMDSIPARSEATSWAMKALRSTPEPTRPRVRSPSRTGTLNQTFSSPVTAERSTLIW